MDKLNLSHEICPTHGNTLIIRHYRCRGTSRWDKFNLSMFYCRVTIWDNGAVIIPNGQAYDKKALVTYDGENFTGNSKEFEIDTYHNQLGEWDNKIRSLYPKGKEICGEVIDTFILV